MLATKFTGSRHPMAPRPNQHSAGEDHPHSKERREEMAANNDMAERARRMQDYVRRSGKSFYPSVISAALVVAFFVSPLDAQILPPGKAFGMTKEARMQLDTMAAQSMHAHAEASACVTRSAMMDSTFVIMAIAPAKHIQHADSISIVTDGPLCEAWQPSIHSHIIDNGFLERPSDIDYHTTAGRGIFGFLLSVHGDSTWSLQAYP